MSADNQPHISAGCERIIITRINAQQGLQGKVIRAGFTALERWRSNFIARAVKRLLPDFCQALQPTYLNWNADARPDWPTYLHQRQDQVVTGLLEVTDQRGQQHDNKLIRATYRRLRPRAEKEIRLALPALGQLLKDVQWPQQ